MCGCREWVCWLETGWRVRAIVSVSVSEYMVLWEAWWLSLGTQPHWLTLNSSIWHQICHVPSPRLCITLGLSLNSDYVIHQTDCITDFYHASTPPPHLLLHRHCSHFFSFPSASAKPWKCILRYQKLCEQSIITNQQGWICLDTWFTFYSIIDILLSFESWHWTGLFLLEQRKISAFGGIVCSPFLWSAVFFPVSFHLGCCGFLLSLYISELCGDEESGCSFSVWVTSSLPWQADERTVQMLGLLPWAPWGHTYKPATRALTTGTALQMSLFKWHPFSLSHTRAHMHTLSDTHTPTHTYKYI